MTFPHGSGADVLFNGKILSGYFNSFTFSRTRDTAETTTFKKKAKTYIPGLSDNTMSMEGFVTTDLDDAVARLDQFMGSVAGGGYVSYFPAGIENGASGYSLEAILSSHEVSSDIGDAVKVSAEFQGDQAFQRGSVVANGSVSSPSASVSGPIGAASAPAYAGIQVSNVASTLTFQFQDSADGSTYADVAGTVVAAAVGGYQLAAPSVRRFVRVKWTGSGTMTILLARGSTN